MNPVGDIGNLAVIEKYFYAGFCAGVVCIKSLDAICAIAKNSFDVSSSSHEKNLSDHKFKLIKTEPVSTDTPKTTEEEDDESLSVDLMLAHFLLGCCMFKR